MSKRLLFLTGTRADFGKLKSLIHSAEENYHVDIFVTGMHMISTFGSTFIEVEKAGFKNTYNFVNHRSGDQMDQITLLP